MKFDGIVFDFNGTLFWDSPKHVQAWKSFSKELRGSAFTDREMKEHVLGRVNDEIIRYLAGERLSADEVQALSLEKERVYRVLCEQDPAHTVLAPGAIELLDFLKERGIPRNIATACEKTNIDYYREKFSLDRWFDFDKIIYDDGTRPGKPAPDIYLAAMRRLELSPERCVVVEDALSGIESARRAGAGLIAVIAPDERREELAATPGVDLLLRDFDDLDRRMFISKQ